MLGRGVLEGPPHKLESSLPSKLRFWWRKDKISGVRNLLGEGATTLTGVNLHAIYTESHTPVEHV